MSVKVETLEKWEGDCNRCGHTRYPSCSQSQCQLDIGYAAAPNRTILRAAEQAHKKQAIWKYLDTKQMWLHASPKYTWMEQIWFWPEADLVKLKYMDSNG